MVSTLDLTSALTEAADLEELFGLLHSDQDVAARAMAAMRKEFETEPDLDSAFPVPVNHPAWWYDPAPGMIPPGKKATFTADGRVYGRFFDWGECIASDPTQCWAAPTDPTNYMHFHQSDVSVADPDGSNRIIAAGGLVPGHSDPWDSFEASIEHYNDPTAMVVTARAYEDDIGGYIVGGLIPGVTWRQALLVRSAPLSGHWEEVLNVETPDGQRLRKAWVCLGPSMVVRPGFPLHSSERLTASLGMVRKADGMKRVATMTDLAPEAEAAPVAEPAPAPAPDPVPEAVEKPAEPEPAPEAEAEAPATETEPEAEAPAAEAEPEKPKEEEAPHDVAEITAEMLARVTYLESELKTMASRLETFDEVAAKVDDLEVRYWASAQVDAPELYTLEDEVLALESEEGAKPDEG